MASVFLMTAITCYLYSCETKWMAFPTQAACEVALANWEKPYSNLAFLGSADRFLRKARVKSRRVEHVSAADAMTPTIEKAAREFYRVYEGPEEVTETLLDTMFSATIHSGDCTKEAHTCLLCEAEFARKMVVAVLKATLESSDEEVHAALCVMYAATARSTFSDEAQERTRAALRAARLTSLGRGT